MYARFFLFFLFFLHDLLLELPVFLLFSMKNIQACLNLFHQGQVVVIQLIELTFRITVFGEVAEVEVGSGETLCVHEVAREG